MQINRKRFLVPFALVLMLTACGEAQDTREEKEIKNPETVDESGKNKDLTQKEEELINELKEETRALREEASEMMAELKKEIDKLRSEIKEAAKDSDAQKEIEEYVEKATKKAKDGTDAISDYLKKEADEIENYAIDSLPE